MSHLSSLKKFATAMKRTVNILMTYAQEQLAYHEERRKQTQQESRATINHPEYYSFGGMEAIDFIDAHGLNFNRGNVIKYVTRAGRKNGEDELTALEKAQWYLDHEIERIKKGKGNP